MAFYPDEILFLPSTWCNLKCEHCAPPQTKAILPKNDAIRFLLDCKKHGIIRVGFTGGEVFLHRSFLLPVVKKSRALDFVFTHITTNGVWFKNRKQLIETLRRLYHAGYDGSFFVSIDAFHRGSLKKVALFIRESCRIWQRPDIVSLAYVWGVREQETNRKIQALSRAMGITMNHSLARGSCCLTGNDYVIRTFKIPFSAARGKGRIRDPWQDRAWFKEDYCRGPGNVLFVLPDGTVKPCCGYGSHSPKLTLGNIKHDSVRTMLSRSRKSPVVRTVFGKGLTSLRKTLQKKGVRFPGKTTDHCVFCEYALGRYGRYYVSR